VSATGAGVSRTSRLGRRTPPLAFLLVLLLGAAWIRVSPVAAHSVLVRADPAPNAKLPASPKVVSIYFSEPLEPKFSSAKVVDATGAAFDQGDSRVDAGDPTHMTLDVNPLKPGFYTVLWTTLSKVDGHKLQGSYPIILLNPDGSVPAGQAAPAASAGSATGAGSNGPADVVAYWLAILGAVTLFGGALFTLAVALPAAEVVDEGAESVENSTLGLERRILWFGLGAFLIGLLAQLLLQLRQLGGLPALPQVLSTSYGEFWLARLVSALLLACCLLGLSTIRDRASRAPLLSLVIFFGLVILACFSLTSHGAAIGNGSFWAVIGDFLHVTMVGVWVGGLLSLALLLRLAARGLSRPSRIRYQAALAARFSPLAAAAVALILLTGTFNAVVQIPSAGGLIHTAYGRSLLLKLGLIVPLLVVAGLNAFLLRPRLLDAAEGPSNALAEADRLQRRLRASVAAEAGLAALVLLVVGMLLIFPPSRDLAGQTPQAAAAAASGSSVYTNNAVAGDLSIQLTVDPNKVGLNTYRIKLADAQGPVTTASLVRLDFTFADPKFGTSNLVLPPVGDGVYEVQGANFAQVGRWGVTAVVRRPGKDDALSSFTVEVPDASGNLTINRVNQVDAFASPSRLFTTDQLGGIVLVLAGLLPLVLRRHLWQFGAIAGAAGTFGGVAGLILGGTLFFAAHQEGTTDYTLLPNPVPVSNQSVAEGKQLYLQNCAVCHGETGHGDGPAAQALNPKPFDLTVHVGLHADGVLWGWITNGIPRTAMPAWKDKLTDTQRWEVVDFLRTAFQASAEAPPPAIGDGSTKIAVAAAWAEALDAGGSDGQP
jgi:copper transport protein